METVIQPEYKLLYNGTEITADVSRFLIEVSYTDRSEGESDELAVTLEDTDALWRGDWYPEKGARLTFEYGYPNNLVPAGEFDIDEISLDGPPDTITIRAMAAVTNKEIRTKRSFAHENKTLRQVVEATAARSGLSVQGVIDDVRFNRLTQDRQTDLEFLKKLSYEFGYLFSIRGDRVIFTSIFAIEQAAPAKSLLRRDLSSYNIRDKVGQTFQKADASYKNPLDNRVIRAQVDAIRDTYLAADTLQIRSRSETQQQADRKARVALYRENSRQQQGSVSFKGDPDIVAGVNIEILQIGELSGIYNVASSRHAFNRSSGYITALEIKRVALVDQSQHTAAPEPVEDLGYEIEEF